jgi:hypothetical protein
VREQQEIAQTVGWWGHHRKRGLHGASDSRLRHRIVRRGLLRWVVHPHGAGPMKRPGWIVAAIRVIAAIVKKTSKGVDEV